MKVTVSRFDQWDQAVARFNGHEFNVRRRFDSLSGARARAWYTVEREDMTTVVFSSLRTLRRDLPGLVKELTG